MTRRSGCFLAICFVGFLLALLFTLYTAVDWKLRQYEAAAGKQLLEIPEIQEMYLRCFSEKKMPPSKLEDLKSYASLFPRGYEAIEAGKWIVLWGTIPSENRRTRESQVIAYQSGLLSRGFGTVVFVIGGQGMSASELRNNLEAMKILPEIGQMYAEYCSSHGRPPTKVSDIAPFADRFQNAYEGISSGSWTVAWGTNPRAKLEKPQQQVLAYMTHASAKGLRWVLTIDGSISPCGETRFSSWCKTGILE